MDLTLLRTFLAVYRADSFTSAASQLQLSQPTVTAQIRALEQQLDQQLFQRLPRGVEPTSVAEELAGAIAPHLDALAVVTERRLTETTPFARPVHLAGPAELITTKALPALVPLVRRGLTLRITTGLADELLAALPTGRFDLVIATIRPRGKAIRAVPLTDEEFVLVASPTVAAGIDLANDGPASLRAVPLISYAEELPIIRRYWRTVFGTRPTRSAAIVVPDLRGVLSATVAGAGITVLPRYLCAAELAAGTLVALLEPELPPINTLFLATRAGTEQLPNIAAVHARLLSDARTW